MRPRTCLTHPCVSTGETPACRCVSCSSAGVSNGGALTWRHAGGGVPPPLPPLPLLTPGTPYTFAVRRGIWRKRFPSPRRRNSLPWPMPPSGSPSRTKGMPWPSLPCPSPLPTERVPTTPDGRGGGASSFGLPRNTKGFWKKRSKWVHVRTN